MKLQRLSDRFISVLSMDLLIQIFDHLPEAGDRRRCRLVSRMFLRAELLHRRSLRLFRPEALALLRRYPSIERLDLSACPSIDDKVLAAAVSGGAGLGLRAVNLSRASAIGWRGLEALVAACPLLEAVDLSHCVGVGDREAAALAAAPRLRELILDKCLAVTDVGLANVAVGCPQLERLGIKWCMEISDIGIDLLTKKCVNLKYLDISYLKVTNESLASISKLSKLEVLSMVHCCYVDDEGLRYLNNGSNSLQSVDISRCENVSSAGLVSIIEGHKGLQKLYARHCFSEISPMFLAKLVGLKDTLNTLVLDGVQITASSLNIISASCKNLVEIGLSKCSSVKDDGVTELVTNCTDLRLIDLTCCHQITDNALLAIATQCKKLECLRLESCCLITEKGLDHIGTSCPSLQEIDLTDCNVNDTALKCLSNCSKIKMLKLGLCPDISEKGLFHIGFNCRELEELDLYRCSGVGDDGLFVIAGGCKKLKMLNLCYCDQITDEGMKHLSCLEELTDLELRGLVRVTGAGISAIAIGCKNLLQLDLKRCYSVDDMGFSALAQHAENLRQIVLSYCPVSDITLCQLLGALRCLQDVKMVHLTRVSMVGFEIALRTSCGRLKKLKLLTGLRQLLSPVLRQMLHTRGCRLRWKIAHAILVEGMKICEQFQVSAAIDKLPQDWKDYKNTLRHKSKEFSMESLILHLRIEEEHRKQDKNEEVMILSNYCNNKKN